MQTEEEYIEMGFLLDYDKNQTLQNLGRIGEPLSEKYRKEAEDAHDQMCHARFNKEGDPFDANKEFSVNDFVSVINLRDDAEAALRKSMNDECDAAIKFNAIANRLSSEDKRKAFKIYDSRAKRNPSIPSMFGYEKSRLTKVRFPTPSDAPFSGESMWVSIVQGDENSGIGTIDNDPQFFDLADYGDMIKYGGGTDKLKPVFKSVVECKPVKRKNNPIFDKVPDNVRDPMLYRKARAKVKSRVNVWPSVYASGQLVQEYKRMGGRYINPSIERGGKISYGEYYGLPDGDGGYDLYYRDEIIASGIDTVEQAEEEIAQHIESL
jgi:hypothetical protein